MSWVPGPWIAQAHEQLPRIDVMAAHGDMRYVAQVPPLAALGPRLGMDTARLIALAPAMADAVLAVFAVHGQLRHTCDEIVSDDCPECAIGLAIRPLAKKLRRIGDAS